MMLRRAMPLVLVGLTACLAAPSSRGSEDTAATVDNPVDDGGNGAPSSFSMLPEATPAMPLAAAVFDGVLPPSWHVDETWEVMFCTASNDWTWTGDYDTTRVMFRVIAVPEPGAYTAVLEVKQHVFPYRAWVGEVATINGALVGSGEGRVILEKSIASRMVFDGQTFALVGPVIHDRYGRASIDHRPIGEHLGTIMIGEFTPHVPMGLRNPELTAGTEHTSEVQRTLTATPDGLTYQVEAGDRSITRTAVFWRRHESWWSYARMDAVDMGEGADAGRDEYSAPAGNTTFSWAMKLPPGQPGSFNCNSKR